MPSLFAMAASARNNKAHLRYPSRLPEAECPGPTKHEPLIAARDKEGFEGENLSLMQWSLQALLIRHEAYMFDAEAERASMAAYIERLEVEKRELENGNAKNIEENRRLLERLESLKHAAIKSESTIRKMEATLESAQEETERLTRLACRAQHFENQITEMEKEHIELQRQLVTTEEESTGAAEARRTAEQRLAKLESWTQRMEMEAVEEQKSHLETLNGSMEEPVLEIDLSGASHMTTEPEVSEDSSDLPRVMKGVLRDNTTLQLDIAELKDLLANSNDEVGKLKVQLQHLTPTKTRHGGSKPSPRNIELRKSMAHELHVHHHYHASQGGIKPLVRARSLQLRRPKKGPSIIGSSFRSPKSLNRSRIRCSSATTASPAVAVSNQNSLDMWQRENSRRHRRETLQSSTTTTSPQSTSCRSLSIWDRAFADCGTDQSRPTSPEGTDGPGSPRFDAVNTRKLSSECSPTMSPGMAFKMWKQLPSAVASNKLWRNSPTLDLTPTASGTALKKKIEHPKLTLTCPTPTPVSVRKPSRRQIDVNRGSAFVLSSSSPPLKHAASLSNLSPHLRRANSHESLFSVRNHYFTPSRGPSSDLKPKSNTGGSTDACTLHAPPVSLDQASTGPVLSAATATAKPAGSVQGLDSRSALRELEQQRKSSAATGGRWSWKWRRWGVSTTIADASHYASTNNSLHGTSSSPTATLVAPFATKASASRAETGDAPASPTRKLAKERTSPPSPKSSRSELVTKDVFTRPAGVNQRGPVRGLVPEQQSPSKVRVRPGSASFDADGLRSTLEGR